MGLAALGAGWTGRVERVLAALAGSSSGAEIGPLCALLDALVTWNARIDLTAARSADELVDLMLADAAALLGPARELGFRDWVDVGAGAGAPGLPLALLAPELGVTLVEPRTKRVAFLRHVLGSVGRGDVRVLRARSDELPAAGWDAAISRATLPPREWLEEGARLARGAVGVFVARAEAPASPKLWPLPPIEYSWPLTGVTRRLLLYRQAGSEADDARR